MEIIMDVFRWVHLSAGFAALMLFWIPALTRKGSPIHRKAGKIYLLAMLMVVVTAVPLTAQFFLDGRWIAATFLGYLAVITVTAGWTGWRVLRFKNNVSGYLGWDYRLLAMLNLVAGATVLGLGWINSTWLLFGFSFIGIFAGADMVRQIVHPPQQRNFWLTDHFGGLIGTGIAAHVAFLAFGARRLWPEWGQNDWGMVFWFGPVIVGVVALILLNRHYRQPERMAVSG